MCVCVKEREGERMRVIVQRRGVDESKMRSNEKRVKNEWNKKEREREREGRKMGK